MKMKKINRLVLAVILLFLCLSLLSGGQLIAADPANSIITLQQELVKDRTGTESIALKAKITRDDGYPLGEKTISFYETYDLFGKSQVFLGSNTTNAVGIATLKYETKAVGDHIMTAKFAGDGEALSAQVTMTFNITQLPSSTLNSSKAVIANINMWGAVVAYGAMAIVLLTLVTLLFLATRGVASNRNAK